MTKETKTETKTSTKPATDKIKKLAEVLADVELPRSHKRLWVEVTPEWIEAAKEVRKSK